MKKTSRLAIANRCYQMLFKSQTNTNLKYKSNRFDDDLTISITTTNTGIKDNRIKKL